MVFSFFRRSPALEKLREALSELLKDSILFILWKNRNMMSLVEGIKSEGGRGHFDYRFTVVEKKSYILFKRYKCYTKTLERNVSVPFNNNKDSRNRYLLFNEKTGVITPLNKAAMMKEVSNERILYINTKIR